MRTLTSLILAALVLSMAGVAVAELQNVEVGGSLQIRGNYWRLNWLNTVTTSAYVQQRTTLNVKADFTNNVSAFVELESYGDWGRNFRSDYLTGIDARGGADVDMYQAYIEAKNLWGTPLGLRVGRQELVFGSQFLLGNNTNGPRFPGLSFDAIRLSFANDMFKADAFAAKLAENFQNFGKGDVDLYGVYGSYIGIQDVTIDAYWLLLQDSRIHNGYNHFNTIGLRGAGAVAGLDFDAEVAYQFGDANEFELGWEPCWHETKVKYDNFGAHAELGYTFDIPWQPRPFVQAAYFGGGKVDEDCWTTDIKLPFNRLFSNQVYSVFLDTEHNLSNLIYYGVGVQFAPLECLTVKALGAYLDMDKSYAGKNSYGWEATGQVTYHYSEDLAFTGGYSHFFQDSNGDDDDDCWFDHDKNNNKGDWDYFYAQTELKF